ncbi:MAG TPA: chemotaxis protein CheB [Actinomycetota bacterium]|nr:chemotaxis protein CheB [Actinomycetota bacterium]
MEWIADHQTLKPGRVLVCPPKRLLEVMPDGDCSLRPIDPHHMLRPIDWFLASVAESYGQGAMAVVLTGMTRPPGGRSPASASTNGSGSAG